MGIRQWYQVAVSGRYGGLVSGGYQVVVSGRCQVGVGQGSGKGDRVGFR